MCRNVGNKFISWTYIYTTITFLGKHVIQTNLYKFHDMSFSDICVQIPFATRKRNTGFYVLRQGIPEGRSSEGYASFKQVLALARRVYFWS